MSKATLIITKERSYLYPQRVGFFRTKMVPGFEGVLTQPGFPPSTIFGETEEAVEKEAHNILAARRLRDEDDENAKVIEIEL